MWRPPGEKWKGVLSVKGLAVIGHHPETIYEAGADAILRCLEEYGVKAALNNEDPYRNFDTIDDEDYDAAEEALAVKFLKMDCPDGTRGLLVFIPEGVEDG